MCPIAPVAPAKTAAVAKKVYKLIASNFIVVETFCRSINH